MTRGDVGQHGYGAPFCLLTLANAKPALAGRGLLRGMQPVDAGERRQFFGKPFKKSLNCVRSAFDFYRDTVARVGSPATESELLCQAADERTKTHTLHHDFELQARTARRRRSFRLVRDAGIAAALVKTADR